LPPRCPGFVQGQIPRTDAGDLGPGKLASQGDFDGAIAEYTRAIQIEPKRVALLVDRARTFEKSGKLNRAIADWDQIISLSRGNWEHYWNRARLNMQLQLYSDALTDYSLAVSAHPQYLELYNDRAIAYQKLGRSAMADDDFRKARGETVTPLNSGKPTLRPAKFIPKSPG
jgi:tetratricopeptide (TPR) repeat protein